MNVKKDLESRSVAELKAIGVICRHKIKVLVQEIADLNAKILEAQKRIPNMTHLDAPTITPRKQ